MKLHVVDARHNGLHAFHGREGLPRCSECGALAEKWNRKYIRIDVPRSMRSDISITYDGVTVVSEGFVQVVGEARLRGLQFHDVGVGFSVLLSTRRVAFDIAARGTRFEDLCTMCGQHGSVAGATPAFLRAPIDLAPDEFAWTDVEFGSGDEKQPLLICGETAGATLRRGRLRGLEPLGDVRGV